MVIMTYSSELFRELIRHDLKRSTIRRRSEKKERDIESTRTINHYYHHRRPDQEHIKDSELKKLTVIEEPILEFIQRIPLHVVYCEGFGTDRSAMEAFFVDHYGKEVHNENWFYMTEWYAEGRQ